MRTTGWSERVGSGKRGGWAALVAGIVAFGVLEAAVLHFLAAAVLPRDAALVADVVIGALTVLFVLAIATPLWSSHRVTRRELRLRFGWLAAMDIPLDAIREVAAHRTTVRRPAELGLDFDDESAELALIRSPSSPLLRITLAAPVPARTRGWRRVDAGSVVLSTDDAEQLPAAIARARKLV
ncbi:hypothetical protein [Nocardia sp. NPDC052566]|uniref:hypothetical protein n=1 Tax=Nocardia sp. NPDC052566 TaxID=3364330 RepID=UPI0037C74084